MKSKERRQFIKTTAAVSGGALLSPLSIKASAYVQGNDHIRVALVGCGGRGTGAALQALKAKENVRIVAMADAFRDQLDKCYGYINEHHEGNPEQIAVDEKNKFSGFDAFKSAIDLADVVILTTPPGFRPDHFEYAIDQGKHVFMEKPLAVDAPGIRKVLDAGEKAKKNKLNVVVGLQRHYQTNYLAALDKIRNGEIGKILSGQVYWNSAGVWVRERKSNQTEMEYQMRNWYYFNWLCGDHILEQHIHNIDVANWFIGEYPATAQGMGGREVRTGKDHGEIFDHHFVEFTYPSGAVISSQCRHQKGTMSRVSETFQGTLGTVSTEGNSTKMYAHNGDEILVHKGKGDPNPYQVEHDRLFESIINGGLISDTENGAKSTMTAIMGRMATYSGQMISWDDALASEVSIGLTPDQWQWDGNPPTLPDADGNYAIPIPGVTNVL
jgi:predicted dehydrogenase